MPDPTEIVKELERLLRAIKVNNVKDKDVAVLENAKTAFETICDNNAIPRRPITVGHPIKTRKSR